MLSDNIIIALLFLVILFSVCSTVANLYILHLNFVPTGSLSSEGSDGNPHANINLFVEGDPMAGSSRAQSLEQINQVINHEN